MGQELSWFTIVSSFPPGDGECWLWLSIMCVMHFLTHTWINSLSIVSGPRGEMLISAFYRWENWGIARQRNLPEITELINAITEFDSFCSGSKSSHSQLLCSRGFHGNEDLRTDELWELVWCDRDSDSVSLGIFRRRHWHPTPVGFAWKIPWTEDPGRLQSMGLQSQTWLSNFTFTFHFHALEKEMAAHSSVLAWRSQSQGWGSLVGCHLWGYTESDTTDVT